MRAARRVCLVAACALLASGLSGAELAVANLTPNAGSQASPADEAPIVSTAPYQVPAEETRGTDESDPAWRDARVSPPAAASYEVDVPAKGWARAGSSPVSIAQPTAGTAPSRVRVRVLSEDEVTAAGGRLLGFEVSRADGGSTVAHVAVSLDYSGVAKAFGGNFASRLRLVRSASCPPEMPCVRPRIAARNEADRQLLQSSAVSVRPQTLSGPAPGSGFGPQPTDPEATSLAEPSSTTYLAAASAGGAAGDFGASSVTPADRWDVGVGSGAFTYSYPVAVPPAPGGAAPALSFDYSSQSVDGRTLAANGQAPKTGEGWSFEPGFIERKFESCPSGSNAGERCWSPKNEYVLHFGGKAGEIVRDAATGEWRLRSDPAWKILERTGGPNSDDNGEYFVLITGDGTKHWFGLGAESTVDGAAATGSVQEVPVYGGSGEPCYKPVASESWCQQAYRWNLDRVVDPNNNVTTFFYAKETNRYARWSTSALAVSYTRASHLMRVEYGQRAGSETSASPWARVLVTAADRCFDQANCPAPSAATAGEYPDVPLDLMCTTITCPIDLDTPTFWSTKQIASVRTEFRNVALTPDVWEWVSTYALSYSFPSPGDGTDPSLWLKGITRTGEYGIGATTTLPGLRLNGVLLPNRVNTGAGVPALNKWRVGYVSTDLNARLVITYDTPHPCPTTPSPATNATDCFPAWYDPQDGTTPPGWVSFYKYLVTKVVTEDNRGGQPNQTVVYTYNDAPAWHYDDSLLAPSGTQSWSGYRGHASVDVEVLGDATNDGTRTRYKLFRGMHGDKLTDSTSKSVTLTDSTGTSFTDYDYLSGKILQKQRFTGGGTAFEETLHRYWSQQTVNGPDGFQSHDAQYVRESVTIDRVKNLNTGVWRDHTTTREYVAATGALRKTGTSGDPDVVGDGICTVSGYAYSDTTWIIDAPYRTDTYAGGCSTTSPTKIAETDYHYDGQAFMTAPSKGNVTETQHYSSATAKSVTKSGYDAYGRVTSVVSPNEVAAGTNGVITTVYAPSTGYPYNGVTTTDVLGRASTVVAYSAFGTPRILTDVNGQVTTVNVDNLGRTTWVARPGDVAGLPSSKYEYVIEAGTTNRVVSQRLLSGTTATNAVYVATYDYLDGLGRVVQTQMPASDGVTTGTRRLLVTRYDAAGGKAAVSQPFAATGAPGSDLAVVAPADVPFETRHHYDYAARIARSSLYASGFEKSTTTTTHRGWSYSVDHPVRSNVDHDVDVYGRTAAIKEYRTAGTITTTYGYTRLGSLERITDDAGNRTTYGYDWLGRRTSSDDPDQGTWSTAYTAEGDVKKVTDAKNEALHYVYDRLRRKTDLWADAVSTGTLLARWRYDTAPNGDPTVSNAVGRLTRATTFTGGAEYTVAVTGYDGRGRVTGRQWQIPPAAGAVAGTYAYAYGYNASDDLITTTVPAAGGLPAETVTTSLNSAGLPTTLSTSLAPTDPYIAGTTYRADGLVAARSLVGGVSRAYGYDSAAARLRAMTTTAPIAGSPATIEDVLYGYDAEHNVTSITDFVAGSGGVAQRECFSYDPLNRLTGAFTTNTTCGTSGAVPLAFGADPYDLGYSYDDLGNVTNARTGATNTSYVYAGSGHAHAPLTIGGATYDYDANGATTTRPTPGGNQTLLWNRLHQLAGVSGPDASSFLYDADGNRLLRTTGATATLYLDGMEVSGPASGSGATAATRFYGGFAARTASGVTVLLRNRQNSTTTAYDTVTDSATYQRYTPYGARRGATALAATERRFLDKTEDPTGLVAMGARYYDPAIGRFVSVDPLTDLAQPQSLAGYSYALGNPATLSDPSGLAAIDPTGGPCSAECEQRYAEETAAHEAATAAQANEAHDIYTGKATQDSVFNQLGQCGSSSQAAVGCYVMGAGGTGGEPTGWGDVLWVGLEVSGYNDITNCDSWLSCALAVAMVAPWGKPMKGVKALRYLDEAVNTADDWPVLSGVLRDASRGKGNFGLGKGTLSQATRAGELWVGDGYRVASDGRSLVSRDGLRVYRPPSWKPDLGKYQANFEYWLEARVGKPLGNGHLDITDVGR